MNQLVSNDSHLCESAPVVWWRGPSSGRWEAVFGTIDCVDSDRVKIKLSYPRKRPHRWAPIDRIQLIRVWHLKAAVLEPRIREPVSEWGMSTRYLEIGEDLYATRTIDVFENGNVLRYDRIHWMDSFSSLGVMQFCRARWIQWWGPDEVIDQLAFDDIWASLPDTNGYRMPKAEIQLTPPPNRPPWIKAGYNGA